MSQKEKLLQRLLKRPKDFTYNEMVTLLRYYNYKENTSPSGSRVRFVNDKSVLTFHKPHPSPILKAYILDMVIDKLRKDGQI